MFCCFSVHLSALSWSPETFQWHCFLQIPPFRSLASLMGGIYPISRFTPVYLSVPATVSHDTSPEPLCFIPFCQSIPGLSSYLWGFMLLSFSSCCCCFFYFFFPLSFYSSKFQDTTAGFDCSLSNCCGISAFEGYYLSVSSALPFPHSSSSSTFSFITLKSITYFHQPLGYPSAVLLRAFLLFLLL